MSWNKSPSDVLDYTFNWSDWLNTGDSIASCTFTINGGDNALSIVGDYNDDSKCVVVLSGGTSNTGYLISCSITTEDGLVEEKERGIYIT